MKVYDIDEETKYITVMYHNGYAVDSHCYANPEDFPPYPDVDRLETKQDLYFG